MKKGITPVIAIIVLLFITIALAGAAWTYLQGFLFGQISSSFTIPPGGAYCQNDVIKVYIQNNAYEGNLGRSDFILADIDGIPLDTTGSEGLLNFDIKTGESALAVSNQSSGGYHTVNLGTSSTVIHQRVYCP